MEKKFSFKLWIILFLFILILFSHGAILKYVYPLPWEHLRSGYAQLIEFEREHPILVPLVFMSIYILYALLSLPGIFIFSLVAGGLFVQPLSTIYVTCSATIGASLLFLLARTAFGELFYGKTNRFLSGMEKGFRKNAVSYLLFLRLIPLSPFWIVNISGAFFKVPFWTFIWTTFFGMIPSVIIYTQAGKELSHLLYHSRSLNPTDLFNPYLLAALIAVATLALFPIFLRK